MIRSTRAALTLALAALLAAGPLAAAGPDDATLKQLHDILAKRLPKNMMGPLAPSPVPGLYEMQVGTRVVYVSADGRYIVQGDVFDLQQSRNLTRVKRDALRAQAVDDLGEQNMIIYEPAKRAHQITVFTDIDCPYCRKMHSEMKDYLDAGIRVRLLFYPRSGPGSSSYDQAVSVWCADDRRKAMDTAMAGGAVPRRSCDNPVETQARLGEQLGIKGTPAIVLEDGTVLDGYRPADWLAKVLAARKGTDK